jgi:predicted nucleic acid-binding protein
MTPDLVIDCSVTMSWCFIEETTAATAAVQDRLQNEAALVPAHWFLEVTNVLWVAENRKRLSNSGADEFLAKLRLLEIQVDHESPARAFDHVLPLCRHHGLTSYDAAYLELALRRQLPLASLDDDLRAAANKLGVELLGK